MGFDVQKIEKYNSTIRNQLEMYRIEKLVN